MYINKVFEHFSYHHLKGLVVKLRTAEESLERVQAEFKQAKWEAEDQSLQREREVERMVSDHQDALAQRDNVIKELKNTLWTAEVDLKTTKDTSRQSSLLLQEGKEKEMSWKQKESLLLEQLEEMKRQLYSQQKLFESKLQGTKTETDHCYREFPRRCHMNKVHLMIRHT